MARNLMLSFAVELADAFNFPLVRISYDSVSVIKKVSMSFFNVNSFAIFPISMLDNIVFGRGIATKKSFLSAIYSFAGIPFSNIQMPFFTSYFVFCFSMQNVPDISDIRMSVRFNLKR
jgi:hypothetical protein